MLTDHAARGAVRFRHNMINLSLALQVQRRQNRTRHIAHLPWHDHAFVGHWASWNLPRCTARAWASASGSLRLLGPGRTGWQLGRYWPAGTRPGRPAAARRGSGSQILIGKRGGGGLGLRAGRLAEPYGCFGHWRWDSPFPASTGIEIRESRSDLADHRDFG